MAADRTLHEASVPLKAGGMLESCLECIGTIYTDGSYKQEDKLSDFIIKPTTSSSSAATVVHVKDLSMKPSVRTSHTLTPLRAWLNLWRQWVFIKVYSRALS